MRADEATLGGESIAGGGFRARPFAAWRRWCGINDDESGGIAAATPRPLQLATGAMWLFSSFYMCRRTTLMRLSLYTQKGKRDDGSERQR